MQRVLTARFLYRVARLCKPSLAADIPSSRHGLRIGTPTSLTHQNRPSQTDSFAVGSNPNVLSPATPTASPEERQPRRQLPVTCTGCGAFAQKTDPEALGFYDEDSKRIRTWLQPDSRNAAVERSQEVREDGVVQGALQSLSASRLEELGFSPDNMLVGDTSPEPTRSVYAALKPPVCFRCHNLLHYNASSESVAAMHHPTVESLRETMEESPHKYNHIYHIIDAADFPMSMIPRLNVLLGDIPLRTRNRRSRSAKFHHDRSVQLSFVITRSDLLAPTKEMVDGMMPYLRDVLRDALGRIGGRIRLGSVRCVSAKRSWWTRELKDEIWTRGGAGWFLGKVNVGKSQLFEAVFPKGRVSDRPDHGRITDPVLQQESDNNDLQQAQYSNPAEPEGIALGDLLPPPQPAVDYPSMPVVSALPGTTASPIRIPFGRGKGELIDLPGLPRSDLELFVKPEHRQSLIMQKRIVPEQVSIKHGKSLVLGGGLICIMPRTENLTFLIYNFTPLSEHLTNNDKAKHMQAQTWQPSGVENISTQEVGDEIRLAGTFHIRHDVTRERAGPLTSKNAVGLAVDQLPFRVLSLDVLIEGVGYLEIVVQVRTKDLKRTMAYNEEQRRKIVQQEEDTISQDPFESLASERRGFGDEPEVIARQEPRVTLKPEMQEPAGPDWPEVDIFTPQGRFVGVRRPINGWLNNRPLMRSAGRTRPRKSMKGAKRNARIQKRALE